MARGSKVWSMSDDEQRGRGASSADSSVHQVDGLLGDLQAAEEQPVAPRRRADAERNRAQILAAAEQLFAEQDPRSVTMDRIAKAAGVGRATLYRSFPDPPSVAVALLDEHERRLQGQLIYGPPPLGPGAPAGERLAAFYLAMLDLLERHLPLALGRRPGPRASGRGRTDSGACTSARCSSTTGWRIRTR
ncbi:Transcriptional regulator, TetR family [Streptomyces venezuelae]|nr:Transcriptional regulator, TetR family [Streptomyces venezuelae]